MSNPFDAEVTFASTIDPNTPADLPPTVESEENMKLKQFVKFQENLLSYCDPNDVVPIPYWNERDALGNIADIKNYIQTCTLDELQEYLQSANLLQLEKYIKEYGLPSPIEIYFSKPGEVISTKEGFPDYTSEDSEPLLHDGYRRLTCVYALQRKGIEIKAIPFILAPRFANEVDRLAIQITSESQERKSPTEQGRLFKRMYNLTHSISEVASKVGRSEVLVKDYIDLVSTSPRFQSVLQETKIAGTTASEILKASRNEQDAIKVLTYIAENKLTRDAALDSLKANEGNGTAVIKEVEQAIKSSPKPRKVKAKDLTAVRTVEEPKPKLQLVEHIPKGKRSKRNDQRVAEIAFQIWTECSQRPVGEDMAIRIPMSYHREMSKALGIDV